MFEKQYLPLLTIPQNCFNDILAKLLFIISTRTISSSGSGIDYYYYFHKPDLSLTPKQNQRFNGDKSYDLGSQETSSFLEIPPFNNKYVMLWFH